MRKYLKKPKKFLRSFSNFEGHQNFFGSSFKRFLNRISKFSSFFLIFLRIFYLYSLETLLLSLNITSAMPQAAISLVTLLRNKLNQAVQVWTLNKSSRSCWIYSATVYRQNRRFVYRQSGICLQVRTKPTKTDRLLRKSERNKR